MSKKYPLCAILKPAPWQTLEESTTPSFRPEVVNLSEETVAMDEAQVAQIWGEETPSEGQTAILAKSMQGSEPTRNVPNFNLIEEEESPFTSTEVWDVDLWDKD